MNTDAPVPLDRGVSASVLLIQPSAWKVNATKSVCDLLYNMFSVRNRSA